MSDTNEIVSPEEIESMHRELLRAAAERARLPEVDLRKIAQRSVEAYSMASRTGSDDVAVATADVATVALRREASAQIEVELGDSAEAASQRKGILSDLLASLGVPISLCFALFLIDRNWGSSVSGRVLVIVTVLLVVFIAWTLRKMPLIRGSVFLRDFAANSSGAMMAGCVVFALGGYFMLEASSQREAARLEAGVPALNQVMALAAAASELGDDPQRIVESRTNSKWTPIYSAGLQGKALVVTGGPNVVTAEVSRVGESYTAQYFALGSPARRAGEEVRRSSFVVGTCAASNLQRFSVTNEEGQKSFDLPKGEVPCSTGAKVIVGLNQAQNEVIFVRPIDALVRELRASQENPTELH